VAFFSCTGQVRLPHGLANSGRRLKHKVTLLLTHFVNRGEFRAAENDSITHCCFYCYFYVVVNKLNLQFYPLEKLR
jgi:hypothetical protein